MKITLEVSDEALANLNWLKEAIKADDYAEVIRDALNVYHGIVKEGDEDARLAVKRPDGTTSLIRLFT